MSKIAILTWHSLPNHGAMLQMYGLSKVFNNMGYDTEIVLHRIESDYKYSNNISQKSKLQKILSKDCWTIRINRNKDTHCTKEKVSGMNAFQKECFRTCKDIGSDVIACCIGSDEVFSLVNNFTPLFYGEGVNCPIFSYAGSFGQTSEKIIELRGVKAKLTKDFKRFIAISVRDENSKRLINFLGNDADIHIDPVLLYGYKKEISEFSKAIENRILLYAYDSNMNLDSEIREIKKISVKYGDIPVVSAGFYHNWCDRCIQVNPLEMIEEFAKSKYVITDTFHGAIISIITHSRFVVKVRNTLNSNKLVYLLEMLGLEDRIAYDDSQFQRILETEIDYDSIEARLEKFRTEAFCYLKNTLRKIEQNGSL